MPRWPEYNLGMEPFDYEPVEDREMQDLMIAEIDSDYSAGRISFSPRLSQAGRDQWKVMLFEAVRAGSSAALADQLKEPGILNEREPSHTSKSGSKKVPSNAADQLAADTFNRYYMRALCERASRDRQLVEAYRARSSGSHRAASHAIEHQHMLPQVMNAYFEQPPGAHDPSLPFGPNSGLSIRIVEPDRQSAPA